MNKIMDNHAKRCYRKQMILFELEISDDKVLLSNFDTGESKNV